MNPIKPRWIFALFLVVGLAGCSVVTEREAALIHEQIYEAKDGPPASVVAGEALRVALAQLGAPYRLGGAHPAEGFDCSGLVFYSFRRVGVRLPRTSAEMYRHVRPIERAELRPGDLLFFRLRSSRISHVGIYAGNGQFIHAPSRGKHVEMASLHNRYWARRYAGAGRV